MLLFNRHLLSPLLQCIGHTLQHASPTPLRFGLCASPLGHVGLPAPSYVAATRTHRRTPPSSSGCRLLIERQSPPSTCASSVLVVGCQHAHHGLTTSPLAFNRGCTYISPSQLQTAMHQNMLIGARCASQAFCMTAAARCAVRRDPSTWTSPYRPLQVVLTRSMKFVSNQMLPPMLQALLL